MRRIKSLPRKMAALVPYWVESPDELTDGEDMPAGFENDWTKTEIVRCYAA